MGSRRGRGRSSKGSHSASEGPIAAPATSDSGFVLQYLMSDPIYEFSYWSWSNSLLRLSATTFSQSVSAMHRNNDIFSNYHSKIGIGVRCATYRRPVVARFEMASHLLKTRLLILLCLSTITHNKFYTSIPRSQKECMFSSATIKSKLLDPIFFKVWTHFKAAYSIFNQEH